MDSTSSRKYSASLLKSRSTFFCLDPHNLPIPSYSSREQLAPVDWPSLPVLVAEEDGRAETVCLKTDPGLGMYSSSLTFSL
uniref:Uncharacterized protein n=1 Tax=Romanomermis culicivorax TaxID=13658 RepID=A0A915K607_ROMCU